MICPFCKKEIPDHTQFCPECGQSVNLMESTGGASVTYWNSVEKEAERDNKLRADAENKIQKERKQKKCVVIGALIGMSVIAIGLCYFAIIFPAQQYDSALALFENGEFNESLQVFESLGSYKNSSQQVEQCRERIREEDYLTAVGMYEENNYSEALIKFQSLGDYKESAKYIGECEVALISDSNINKTQETSKTKEDVLSGDYVIADSNSRYLTSSELQKFSLKEINYAKNEIYARRGRKFQSKELRDYFNSKSWYKGTIEPDAFQWDTFNDYEKANAELLLKVEFERDSKGYLLDQ